MNDNNLPTNLQSAETGSLVYAEGWSYSETTYEQSLLGKSCLVMRTKTEPHQSPNSKCQYFSYGGEGNNSHEDCQEGKMLCYECEGSGETYDDGQCGWCLGEGCLNGTTLYPDSGGFIAPTPDTCPACNGEGTWENITTIEIIPLGESERQVVRMNGDGTISSFCWGGGKSY